MKCLEIRVIHFSSVQFWHCHYNAIGSGNAISWDLEMRVFLQNQKPLIKLILDQLLEILYQTICVYYSLSPHNRNGKKIPDFWRPVMQYTVAFGIIVIGFAGAWTGRAVWVAANWSLPGKTTCYIMNDLNRNKQDYGLTQYIPFHSKPSQIKLYSLNI